MKNFVVSIVHYAYEIENHLVKVEAKDDYNAVNLALLEICKTEEEKEDVRITQSSPNYPKNFTELSAKITERTFGDLMFKVIEI